MSVRRLFWDIETSPNICYCWSTGRKITIEPSNILEERAIICICYKWENDPEIHHLRWHNKDDRQMLLDFAEVAKGADELVAHNGDYFDMRWFNGRNFLHRLPPLPHFKTVDTLRMARSHLYLNSNRLDYLGKMLFGRGKNPSGFALWKRVCGRDLMEALAIKHLKEEDGHPSGEALAEMIDYCGRDVELVEACHSELRSYAPPASHEAVQASHNVKDRWMCPYCGTPNVSTSKTRTTRTGMIRFEMKCRECERYYSIAENVHKWYRAAKRVGEELVA